jgi:hypothetical protein
VAALKEDGVSVRFVLGIDLGGTSVEVLREICSWGVDTLIVRHRNRRHVFHPKLYLFEWGDAAEVVIGSNNLTEGGFFNNYEGCARVSYELPADTANYRGAQQALNRFLDPRGSTTYPLTEAFIRKLVAQGEVPTEAVARANREGQYKRRRRAADSENGEVLFGTEEMPSPPPLPAELLERLVAGARRSRRQAARTRRGRLRKPPPISPGAGDILSPAGFYMTLPTLQGGNIPGEGRIPLEAIELAQEFWGWPDEYRKAVSPRKGKRRVYWNWKPRWRVWSVEQPEKVSVQDVRMYMYDNSSDFRFYAKPLVNAGADLGDVVRIRRIAEGNIEFECVLARQGTPPYAEWIKYCTEPVRNSPRSFGYA